MNFNKLKQEGVCCSENRCEFFSYRYEQNCGGEDRCGDPAVVCCEDYKPVRIIREVE